MFQIIFCLKIIKKLRSAQRKRLFMRMWKNTIRQFSRTGNFHKPTLQSLIPHGKCLTVVLYRFSSTCLYCTLVFQRCGCVRALLLVNWSSVGYISLEGRLECNSFAQYGTILTVTVWILRIIFEQGCQLNRFIYSVVLLVSQLSPKSAVKFIPEIMDAEEDCIATGWQ